MKQRILLKRWDLIMSNLERAPQTIVKMSQEKATMKEKIFVTKWLLSLREYVNGGEVAIAMWLEENDITTFSEVSIVDAAGEVLFDVPSILMRQDKLLPDSVSSGISDILYRADNMSQVMPGRGNQFIRNEITSKVNAPNTIKVYQQRWDDIFTRYGLEPVFSNNDTSSTMSIDDGDFDDYEEL